VEYLEKAVALVRSIVAGDSPVTTVLGILCIYLAYQAGIWRNEARKLSGQNEKLHDRIEFYLESGWRAQMAERETGRSALPEDDRTEAGTQRRAP